MVVSQKQLEANRKNAKKGGVKTAKGREIVKYNALKHGLLAREAVVTAGEGAENPAEFSSLLDDLKAQLQPHGPIEEMLLEKIAVAYWRLRRAYRYEAGLIRQELDTATDDFYGQANWEGKGTNKTDDDIDKKIREEQEALADWEKDKRDLSRMRKQGKPLEDIYDWEGNWEWLEDKVSYLSPSSHYEDGFEPKALREFLRDHAEWSDDQIWQALIDICDERVAEHKAHVVALENEKERNRLKLQVLKMLGNVPSRLELDRLLRYEGAIERQFYKALNQLERLQRLRAGDNVPAPIQIDVDVNAGQDG